MANALTVQDLIDLRLVLDDAYDVSYKKALESKPNWLPQLAKYVQTTDTKIHLPFFYNTVGMTRQNIGDPPSFHRAIGKYVDVEVVQWSNGFTIHETQFHNPIYMQYILEQVNTLPVALAYSPLQRACDLLNNGDTDPFYAGYDGQQVFSTTHSVGSPGATWRNLWTGSLYDIAAVGQVFNQIKANAQRIPWGPDGKFLDLSGAEFIVMVPPELEFQAGLLFNNSYFLQTNLVGDNYWKGQATVICENRLTDPNDWFVIVNLPNVKPFVHVEQVLPSSKALISNIDPKDPNVTMRGMYEWSIRAYEEVTSSQFFLLNKVTNS